MSFGMDRWTDGWTDGQMEGHNDRQQYPSMPMVAESKNEMISYQLFLLLN